MIRGTQKALAQASNVSVQYVNQVVNLKKPITKWATAKKFAQLTGTDPADWMDMRTGRFF